MTNFNPIDHDPIVNRLTEMSCFIDSLISKAVLLNDEIDFLIDLAKMFYEDPGDWSEKLIRNPVSPEDLDEMF